MSEVDVSSLVKAFLPIYKAENEKKLFTSMASELFKLGNDIVESESILIALYNQLPSHSTELSEILDFNDKLHTHDKKPDGGMDSLKRYASSNYDKDTAVKSITELRNQMNVFNKTNNYSLDISETTRIIMNNNTSEVEYETLKFLMNGDITSTTTRVLLCYPQKIIVHDNPLSENGELFSITWRTRKGAFFNTNMLTVPETEDYLTNHGYVLSPAKFKGLVTALLQIAYENDLAIMKNEVETPGFYLNNDKDTLKIIKYDLHEVDKEKLSESLLLINDLENFFKGSEDKLATTLKHAIVSPFGFAKKQLGQPLEMLVPYMYHFGTGGAGKTTIARIGLYFYGVPDTSSNDIGGAEFDTVYRIGEAMKNFTFGLIVNEPETTFSRKSCAGILKSAMERCNGRARGNGGRLEHILALSTLSFASNIPLPDIEGLPRRFVQLLYTHNERKSEKEKKKFIKHYNLDNPNECEFLKLQELGNFAVTQIKNDVSLLNLSWKELANKIFMRAYIHCEMKMPEWLFEFVENISMEDIDEEKIEEIRMFFIDEINRASHKIQEIVEETGQPRIDDYSNDIRDASWFSDNVFHVLNNHQLSYAMLHKDNICFTSGVAKGLDKYGISVNSLRSLSELLGWRYGTVRLKKPTMCMYIDFEEFLMFLYPNGDEYED